MHVFYIHSHITYVLAKLFITEHKLQTKNIRYITSRGYSLNEKTRVYDITEFYNYLEKASKMHKVFNLNRKIKVLDIKINSLVNTECFTVYVPQFNHSLFQILATHTLCTNSVLLEEGITSYKNDIKLYRPLKKSHNQLLSVLYGNRFFLNNSHYHPFPLNKFKYGVCINKDCFPFLEKKKILHLENEAITSYRSQLIDNATVFLLDSFKERSSISLEVYLKVVEDTLKLLSPDIIHIYIKFHPEQNEKTRSNTIDYIKEKFNFKVIKILTDQCILEFEFLKCKKLTVIGMHTSLLFYADNMEHKVISSLRLTSNIPEVNNYIDHVMDKMQKEKFLSYE